MGGKIVKENKSLMVILISLVIIGAVILTNFISFSGVEDTLISQMANNQQIKTEYAASQIEEHIRQVKEELTTLSKFPVMETLDISQCSGDMKIIHESIEGKINSLLRIDENGNIVECSSPAYSSYIGLNVKNKDYFKVPKETEEPFIAGLVSQGTNQQIIVSAPLFETTKYTPYPNFVGEFKGIFLSIVELNDLYNIYIRPLIEQEQSSFLLVNLENEDTILKSNNIEDYAAIKIQLLGNTSDNKILNIKGYGKTIVTSSNFGVGSKIWRLYILTPVKAVRGKIESVQRRQLISLGFVTIIIVGITSFMIKLYTSKEEIQEQLEKASVTLEKFGISIGIERDKYAQADVILETKKIYLVKEDEENHAHELFISSLNRGFAGLGIVREDPRNIKKRYNLQKTSFIWLTSSNVEGIPCETNIDNLFKLISEFIAKSEKSVVLLDRLDYILTENKFEDVIKKIHSLRDIVSSYESIIIISVNPELTGEQNLKALEAETIDLYGKHLRKKVELSEMEMNIIKYVNDKNITNRLASYKDITENFKITKPTTRAKINRLQNLGLLQVEQKGRFKSLKITSAGRRIIS